MHSHPLPDDDQPDLLVDSHGGLIILTPLSDDAEDWCEENITAPELTTAPDSMGPISYVCERRQARDIMDAMNMLSFTFQAGDGFDYTLLKE